MSDKPEERRTQRAIPSQCICSCTVRPANCRLNAPRQMPVERIAMLWNSLPLETDPGSVVAFVRAIERFHGVTVGAPEPAIAAWSRRAALPVAPSDERQQFEADAEPMGFDLTRQSVAAVEPWSEYVSEATGHRWAGWRAARALPVAAPSDADRELMEQALALISWHCFGECRVMTGPLPIAANIAAALRTRLLRHSEGKE